MCWHIFDEKKSSHAPNLDFLIKKIGKSFISLELLFLGTRIIVIIIDMKENLPVNYAD